MWKRKTADAARARKLGLVDAVTEERHVGGAVRAALAGKLRPRRPWLRIVLMNSRFGRHFLGGRMYKEAQLKAPREHYPAPAALIELWERHGGRKSAMLKAERASFPQLMAGETSPNLVRLFFLPERLKKPSGPPPGN